MKREWSVTFWKIAELAGPIAAAAKDDAPEWEPVRRPVLTTCSTSGATFLVGASPRAKTP